MAPDRNQGGSSERGGTSARGFASMDEGRQREIASKGGQSVPDEKRSFSQDRALAAQAGRKGGEARGRKASLAAQHRDQVVADAPPVSGIEDDAEESPGADTRSGSPSRH